MEEETARKEVKKKTVRKEKTGAKGEAVIGFLKEMASSVPPEKAKEAAKWFVNLMAETLERQREVRPNQVYSPKEAAKLLQMKKDEVLMLLENGDIKGVKTPKGDFRIQGEALLDYLSGR